MDKKEREFHQQNNPHKTFWVVGEIFQIGKKEYVIGYIRPMRKTEKLHIRLDRKFEDSIWIFVPR